MKLKIRAVGPNDFGTYRCVAKNSLGETDGNIKLDGKRIWIAIHLHFLFYYIALQWMFFPLKTDLVVQTTSLNYFIILTISLIAYRNANTTTAIISEMSLLNRSYGKS